MKDYSFGNFICELRCRRGLSQFQLGTLVGVSDKAVSKWETGVSKPRLPVCGRLADALGITLDELLACKYNNSSHDGNGVFAMKKNIWDTIDKRMHTLYGDIIPARIAARYESEKRLMDRNDLIVHFSCLADIRAKADESCMYMWYLGDINSSFIAWLMGITSVNPLEPHYYCPGCGSVEFIHDARDGYDLKPKRCKCGKHMTGDGHGIPFENTIYHLERSKAFEAAVPGEMLPEALHIIEDYYSEASKLARVGIRDKRFGDMTYYILTGKEEHTPDRPITLNEYNRKYGSHIKFAFVCRDKNELLSKLCRLANRRPSMINIIHSDIVPVCLHAPLTEPAESRKKLHESVLSTVQPNCYSELLMTEGILRSTGAWEDNQQPLYKSGIMKLSDMLIFREDIYELISSATKEYSNSGTGLELRIMENVYKGRYALNGMPDNDRILLQEIGIDDMYIDIMSKICYLFPKAHCVASLQADILLKWFMINNDNIFKQTATSRIK